MPDRQLSRPCRFVSFWPLRSLRSRLLALAVIPQLRPSLPHIESYQGESHCDWDKVTFLRVGWPLGTESDDTSHMYVRDPHGVLADKTLAKYGADASLPEAAEDTGYSSEDGELWLVPDDKTPSHT